MNESERIAAGKTIDGKVNDWSFLFSHYFEDDMIVAGMTEETKTLFFSPDMDPGRLGLKQPWLMDVILTFISRSGERGCGCHPGQMIPQNAFHCSLYCSP